MLITEIKDCPLEVTVYQVGEGVGKGDWRRRVERCLLCFSFVPTLSPLSHPLTHPLIIH